MSYCRWSSDDFQCDVYVYGNVHGGVTIHVAKRRTLIDRDKVPRVPDDWYKPESGYDMGEIAALFNERHAYFEACESKEIGLPHDGESFDLSLAEASRKLAELKALGYNVPQEVIDELMEEAKSELSC